MSPQTGVFCGIKAGLFKSNRIVYRPQHCGRWNHSHKSPLFKKGRNVMMEVTLPHFWVRPFCVVISSLHQNQEAPGFS